MVFFDAILVKQMQKNRQNKQKWEKNDQTYAKRGKNIGKIVRNWGRIKVPKTCNKMGLGTVFNFM